ncbi:hypothetical protein N039_11255 [Staphylococcus sp. EGD-HP3]|nr:hypothetical protein N039_11255 [Staphylococcus sp. EGD-HP3]
MVTFMYKYKAKQSLALGHMNWTDAFFDIKVNL